MPNCIMMLNDTTLLGCPLQDQPQLNTHFTPAIRQGKHFAKILFTYEYLQRFKLQSLTNLMEHYS